MSIKKIISKPRNMLAKISDLPPPDHLTKTVEVQLTDDIRAKAAKLNHDPQ